MRDYNRKCIKCQVDLNEGNITESKIANHCYVCSSCQREYDRLQRAKKPKVERPKKNLRELRCRKCLIELRAPDTITENRLRAGNYVCDPCHREYRKEYYRKNHKKKSEQWLNHPRREELKAKARLCQLKHRDKYKEKRRENAKNHLPTRIRLRLGGRINTAIKGICKSARTMELIGTTVPKFIEYLESLFKDGMTWENYGTYRIGCPMTWHVDHIRPCKLFDLTDPAQQRVCFHYTNLQPLWANENRLKGCKTPEEWASQSKTSISGHSGDIGLGI